MVAATLALSGCVGVLSHSYAYTEIDRRPEISDSDSTTSFFHLGEPLIENLVVDLTHSLEASCAGAPLVNVQTKVYVREFVLFQIYTVRLTAACSAPPSSAAPASAPG
jgi:hypothetical protein